MMKTVQEFLSEHILIEFSVGDQVKEKGTLEIGIVHKVLGKKEYIIDNGDGLVRRSENKLVKATASDFKALEDLLTPKKKKSSFFKKLRKLIKV